MEQARSVSGLRAILAILLLAGCQSGDPAPTPPTPTATHGAAGPVAESVSGPERRIVALGDSLFAGYNIARGDAYPAQLQAALRARGIDADVVNAGVSGDTSGAGRQRLAFTLDGQPRTPDLLIVELGGNDLLRGLPVAQTRANLSAILAEAQKRGIPTVLMGLDAPPNLGADYVAAFDAMYRDLAKQYGATLIANWVGPVEARAKADPGLVQGDNIHPTARGVDVLVAATADRIAAALPPAAAN